MSALVGYGSSDEDDTVPPPEPQSGERTDSQLSDRRTAIVQETIAPSGTGQSLLRAQGSTQERTHAGQRHEPEPSGVETNGTSAPGSDPPEDPRTAIRNLTMPPVPNLDIPGSPPGTPPPVMKEKVQRFLQLKKQGIHFNEKLASSSSLKNPSLLGKLSVFAGLSPEDQYATTLPENLWNPQGFPAWAYKEELGKAQDKAIKIREQQKAQGLRPGVEFVKAKEAVQQPDRTQSLAQRESRQIEDKQRQKSRDREHRKRSRSPERRRR